TSEPIDHWTRMRRFLARFSGPGASHRSRSWADAITTTSGFELSVHTASLAFRILVSLRSFMGEWSLGCLQPASVPDQPRPASVPGEAGWAWTGAHRAPATQHRRIRWCDSRLVDWWRFAST